MMVNGIIYQALDTTNGKAYIGQTCRTLEDRKSEHLKKRGTPFHESLHDHPDKFVWSVLKMNIHTHAVLDLWESKLITTLETIYPQGYNLTDGGRDAYYSTTPVVTTEKYLRSQVKVTVTKTNECTEQQLRSQIPASVLEATLAKELKHREKVEANLSNSPLKRFKETILKHQA